MGRDIANEFLIQFQNDMLNIPIVCPNVKEITVNLAGLAVGF